VRDASGKEPPRFWLARLNSLPIRGKQAAQGKRAQGGEKGACAAGAGGTKQSGSLQEALNQGHPIDLPGCRGIHGFRGDQPPDSIDKHADTTPSRTGIRGGLIHPQSIMRGSPQWPRERKKKRRRLGHVPTTKTQVSSAPSAQPAALAAAAACLAHALRSASKGQQGAPAAAAQGEEEEGTESIATAKLDQSGSEARMLRTGPGSRAHIYSSRSSSSSGVKGRVEKPCGSSSGSSRRGRESWGETTKGIGRGGGL